MKNVYLIFISCVFVSVSALGKGESPKTKSLILSEPKEFCHEIGCITVGPGTVEVYDFPEPELYKVTLSREATLAGIKFGKGAELSFAYSNPDVFFIDLVRCQVKTSSKLGQEEVIVAGIQFQGRDLCITKEQYARYAQGVSFDYLVTGRLLRSTQISGLPISTYSVRRGEDYRVAVAIRSGLFTSEDPKDSQLVQGNLSRGLIMNFPGGIGVPLERDDHLNLWLFSKDQEANRVQVLHSEERTLQKGFRGSESSYSFSEGQLMSFNAGQNEVYNTMQVEPGTRVTLYQNGQVQQATPRLDIIQRIQNLNIGDLGFGVSDISPVYFWPNGLIQYTRLAPTFDSGIKLTYSLFEAVNNFAVDGYAGVVAYNPEGLLRVLSVRKVNLPNYEKVGFKGKELVDMPKTWKDEYHLGRYPTQKLIEFLKKN